MTDYGNEISKALNEHDTKKSQKEEPTKQQLREEVCKKFARKTARSLNLHWRKEESLAALALELFDAMDKLK